jgi:hypothetical protein
MADQRKPHEIIAELVAVRRSRSDAEILAELAALPPLSDESDPSWDDPAYWRQVAYPYVALGDLAAERRLRPAILLLLDRACYGDPGEIMRGLRHICEAIVNPDWGALTAICLEAAKGERPGTRLWAIAQLAILDDPSAEPVFEQAIREGPNEIRWRAEIGLERLRRKQK